MDVSDWVKPEVIQVLEQYVQEPTSSIEDLQKEIQRITGKSLTVNKLRHHLEQFQKVTRSDTLETIRLSIFTNRCDI